MADHPRSLSGWGRTAPTTASVLPATSVDDVCRAIAGAGNRGVVARGLGRSYGDAAQNAGGTVLDLTALDEVSDVDPATGLIRCGAGVTFDALLRRVMPLGWFVPVTPGTRQVTVGGAISADVHGKNHHVHGSIADHVHDLTIVDGTGRTALLSPTDELFWAVPGGMGLTGVIVAATLRLRRISTAWMTVDTHCTSGLDDTLTTLSETDSGTTYSVAWIDCLARGSKAGRGVITNAEHTERDDLPDRHREPLAFRDGLTVSAPPWAPSQLLNARSVAVFNHLYSGIARATPKLHHEHASSYFHPLDAVRNWNRLYGRPGFVQYQFVSPDVSVVELALRRLREIGAPGLLAVLKRFGNGSAAPLSFPTPGWTLAVDIPASVQGLGAVLDELDERVAGSGGRVYLAKDARVRRDIFAAMYPRLDEWRALRAQADPAAIFRSDLARRLAL